MWLIYKVSPDGCRIIIKDGSTVVEVLHVKNISPHKGLSFDDELVYFYQSLYLLANLCDQSI